MGKNKCVIFDLDGTLLNTIEDIADSMNTVLKKYGYKEHKYSDYKHFVGYGVLELVKRSLGEEANNSELVEKLHKEFLIEYDKNWNNKTKLYPGVWALIESLLNNHIKLAILSNKPDDFVKKAYEFYLSEWKFERVYGVRKEFPAKPAPEAMFALLNELEADRDNTFLVGDTPVDIETARNSNIRSIAVTWGFRDEKELLEAKPNFIATYIDELIDTILACFR